MLTKQRLNNQSFKNNQQKSSELATILKCIVIHISDHYSDWDFVMANKFHELTNSEIVWVQILH